MFKHKKHLFFDLDHTLWDFEHNAKECLQEIYETENLHHLGADFEKFFDTFSIINKQMWSSLEKSEISHEDIRRFRFQKSAAAIGAEMSEEDSLACNEHLLRLLPHKTKLIDGSLEVLDALKGKYELHILSNGYQEVQQKKIASSKITDYFTHIVTNDEAGARKPDKAIFEYALSKAMSPASAAIMIGDSYEADIKGAKGAGIESIFFDQHDTPGTSSYTHKITKLTELLTLF